MNLPTHSISREEGRCVGCVTCCKACPTRAIRLRHGVMQVNASTCIDCGECLRVCPNDAVRVRTSTPADLKKFRFTVAIPSPTLYVQFGQHVTPEQVGGALVDYGFNAVYDGTWIDPMVSSAVDTYLAECSGPWPKISVMCPAVVRLVFIRFPDLAPHLVPIHTPRELKAKVARRGYAAQLGIRPEEIGIFYITPCSAIMQSIVSPVGLPASHFDGAFSVASLYGSLLRSIRAGRSVPLDDTFTPGALVWAMSGGECAGMRNVNTLAISGVKDILTVFNFIEADRFQHVDFLETCICPDGCVSGQLLVEGRYTAIHTLQRMLAKRGAERPGGEEKARALFYEHFFDMEGEFKAPELRPAPGDLQRAVKRRQAKTRILERLPHKECAACGAPDCAALAEDIADGQASLADCVFVKIEHLERSLLKEGTRD